MQKAAKHKTFVGQTFIFIFHSILLVLFDASPQSPLVLLRQELTRVSPASISVHVSSLQAINSPMVFNKCDTAFSVRGPLLRLISGRTLCDMSVLCTLAKHEKKSQRHICLRQKTFGFLLKNKFD